MSIQEELQQGVVDLICHYDILRTSYLDLSREILKYLDEKNARVKTQHQWGVLPHEWDTKWERLIDED